MEAVTPIPKIRAGNEFTFVWAISRDGIAENLTDAAITDLKLTVCVGGLCAERVEVPFTIVDTNKIQSSHLYERTGTYNLELTYKKAGVENEIDIEAFKIVSRSADASESSEFAVSSDMAIGFKGDSGNGIQSITLTSTVGKVKTYTITFSDLTTTTFTVTDGADGHSPVITFVGTTIYVDGVAGVDLKGEKGDTGLQGEQGIQGEKGLQGEQGIQGEKGDTGNGIQSITLLSTVGLVKTYRVTYTDGTTYDYTVTDGASAPIVQTTGTSETDVMSQKAVTDELAGKQATLVSGTNIKTVNGTTLLGSGDVSNLIASYTHSGNKEVTVTAVDLATGVFTAVGHGLINGDMVVPLINLNIGNVYPIALYPKGLTYKNYYIVNATVDTFNVSLTSGGAAITFTTNATMDLTKWHFEKYTITALTITGLDTYKCRIEFRGRNLQVGIGLYILPVNIAADYLGGNTTTYGLPLYIDGDMLQYIDAEIDATYALFIKYKGIAVSSNTEIANTVTQVNTNYVSPKLYNQKITQIIFNRMKPNGTTVKIYKME